MNKKVLLMILDGWGEGRRDSSNAIFTAGTPQIDALRAKYPVSHLAACGGDVGLPDGQMGNSEVGHLCNKCKNVAPLRESNNPKEENK